MICRDCAHAFILATEGDKREMSLAAMFKTQVILLRDGVIV